MIAINNSRIEVVLNRTAKELKITPEELLERLVIEVIGATTKAELKEKK